MKGREKELKYEIYLVDQEIKQLKKQKKKYVDELRSMGGTNEKYKRNKKGRYSNIHDW